MAFYEVVLKPSAEKELRALPKPVRVRILARLEDLGREPMPRLAVKLAGGEGRYRVRVGDYRTIYGVDTRIRQITVAVNQALLSRAQKEWEEGIILEVPNFAA